MKEFDENENGMNTTYNRQSLASLAIILCVFFGLAFSVKSKEQNNFAVVLENKNKKLLVEDVKTKEQKTLDWRFALETVERLKYLQTGDTVNIKMNSANYAKQKTIILNLSSLDFNKDSIYARQKREIFDVKRQEMMKVR